jgi:hypothetical protein
MQWAKGKRRAKAPRQQKTGVSGCSEVPARHAPAPVSGVSQWKWRIPVKLFGTGRPLAREVEALQAGVEGTATEAEGGGGA